LQCTVQGISHRGEGVARVNGKVVFIPFALPGETVEIEISSEKRKYARGILHEIVESSNDRIEPLCPYYYQCGGCAYQHVQYSKELEFKKQTVMDNIKRIAKLETPVNDVIGMNNPWQYRNKVTWHIEVLPDGKKVLGYYKLGSHRVIAVKECRLLPEKINSISAVLSEHINAVGAGKDSSIVIRQSAYNHKTMVIFVNCRPDKGLLKKLDGMVDTVCEQSRDNIKTLSGSGKLLEKAGNMLFEISAGVFFQVNPLQTESLLLQVKKQLKLYGGEKVLDAYCGVGTIALNIADQVSQITGIEEFSPSIEDARQSAGLNDISNCQFTAGRCEDVLKDNKQRYDAVVIDPPRAGCKPDVIDAIIKTRAHQIVYVSCSPSTLARDLGLFAEHDYKVVEVQPVDMFPRTSHVECVVVIERG